MDTTYIAIIYELLKQLGGKAETNFEDLIESKDVKVTRDDIERKYILEIGD
jgi:CRISPR/Cas system CSM-associated protein Csm4 (group 5 of RAMP superfamily)